MASRLDIHDIIYIAEIRGGKCLSKKYVNNVSPLKWICEKGHTWDAPYATIQQGGWCVQCIKEQEKKEWFSKFQKIAKERNGKCLSKKYETMHVSLQWQCDNGHTWMAKPSNIIRGGWCRICSNKQVGISRRTPVARLHELARSHGGKFLLGTYISTHSKLKWQCRKGHQWWGSAHSVKRGGWCPTCAGRKNYTIKDMKFLAHKKGGKCLSLKFINCQSKLKWKCDKGHVWETVPGKIIYNGSWCPVCARAPKYTIGDMQILARKRKGKCLSTVYKRVDKKIKWQCKYGHKWEGKVGDVIYKKSWCPVCARQKSKRRRTQY